MIDSKELKNLIKLMKENDLTEISIKDAENSVSLKKGGQPSFVPQVIHAPVNTIQSAGQTVVPSKIVAEPEVNSNLIEIKSPMVGTFYRSPSPDSPAFVEAGQEIQTGKVLCILEAMKLMNEVKSEIGGKIVKILVENAQPVEFGQPLFLVEKK